MKTNTINALELLKSQHTEVEDLIEKIGNARDAGKKTALFNQLADNLAAHAAIEEKLFYPACDAKKTHDSLIEATEEHLAVKRLLADMMAMDCEDEHFDAKLEVLKENIKHHAHEEEEAKLFPQVRKMMSADELAALGNEMLDMFEMLMAREPRRNIPAETAEAAQLVH